MLILLIYCLLFISFISKTKSFTLVISKLRKYFVQIQTKYYKIINKQSEEVIVVQIAGLIARRIVCEVSKDQELDQGSRIGMIRFGSRVDIYFENYIPLVKVNQKTIAGETLLAKK